MDGMFMSMRKCALLSFRKIDKLAANPMAEKLSLKSEGEQLESILDELQREQQVREISGWDTGFANLSRALDGLLPGLYLLIGPPGCGKTAFAKQLLDQVTMHNSVPGIFFSFTESRKELRIKTLARLSGVENREIRRGSAYLLHWYGVPKAQYKATVQLPPSWEKLKSAAEEAKPWLDLTYLVQCHQETTWQQMEDQIEEIRTARKNPSLIAVVDDSQRVEIMSRDLDDRLAVTAEQLQGAALKLQIPVLGVWPDLGNQRELAPEAWSERVPNVDVIMVMQRDLERTKKLIDPNQAITLYIVKNRGGERGKLAFDFLPAFARFAAAE
jgi:replicative DNA helicase